MLTLPNILTLSRIVAVPVLVALMWVPGPMTFAAAFILYVIVAVTDFFDGWLARKMNAVSKLGAFLDPIADKIMVAAVLMMLIAVDVIHHWEVIAAIIILLREIVVSGLREYLAGSQVSMPVSQLAKWKTTVQMIAQGGLILAVAVTSIQVYWVGVGALWLAAVLSVVTGWDYLRIGLRHMR